MPWQKQELNSKVRLLRRSGNHCRTTYILMNGVKYEVSRIKLDNPISGTVYGTLLNYKGSLEAMKGKIDHPPYNEPPKGLILYIKPRNTFSSYSNPVPLPTGIPELEIEPHLE